jgi:hypothetical protein
VTAIAGLESLADGLVTAVRVGTGAAHLYAVCGAFAALVVVDTVFNIAADTSDLIHFVSLLFVL